MSADEEPSPAACGTGMIRCPRHWKGAEAADSRYAEHYCRFEEKHGGTCVCLCGSTPPVVPSAKEVATVLRAYREAKGLSIDQLADRTKINRTVLYRMEALETAPRADNLARVCLALELTPEQAGAVLFSYEDYWRRSIRATGEGHGTCDA